MTKYSIYRSLLSYIDNNLNDTINEYLYSEITLDDNNNIVSDIKYNEDNEITSSFTAEYDSNNNITKEITIENDECIDNISYTYNGNLLIEERHIFDDDYEELLINTYDEEGKRISQESFDGDENLNEKLVYSYSGKNLVKIEYEDEDGEKTPNQDLEYDDRGNVVKMIYTNLDNKKLETVNVYDEKNRLVETKSYNEFKRVDSFETNEYDELNRLVKSTKGDINRTLLYFYQYNDNNQATSVIVKDKNGIILLSRENTYDNGRIVSSTTETIQPEMNKRDVETLRWEY